MLLKFPNLHLLVSIYRNNIINSIFFLHFYLRLKFPSKGTTVVKGIKAMDADKPATPNSNIRYLIAASKSQAKYSLVMEEHGSAAIVLKEPLNFDGGDERFLLEVYAKDDGSPSRNASTIVDVRVKRDESRVLKFTSDVYHSQFKEHFPISVWSYSLFTFYEK